MQYLISKTTYISQFKIGKITKVFILFTIIGSLCILYLTNTNNMAIKGFDINQLEKKRMLAEKENEYLKSLLSIEKSINSIKTSKITNNMIPEDLEPMIIQINE